MYEGRERFALFSPITRILGAGKQTSRVKSRIGVYADCVSSPYRAINVLRACIMETESDIRYIALIILR